MLGKVISKYKKIAEQDLRTYHQYKNIALSLFYKGISFLASFALVPIVLGYLNNENYGVWVTVASILTWTTLFDLGLGNGLKNKLSTAIAKNDLIEAKQIVSTAYFLIGIIAILLCIISVLVAYTINWNSLINTSYDGLNNLIFFCLLFFSIRLFFDLINSVLHAFQRTGYVNLISTVHSVLTLIAVLIVTHFQFTDKLLALGLVVSCIPLFIMIAFTIFLFSKKYKNIKPSFKNIKKRHIEEILSLGSRFFIIQLIVLLAFSTDNLIVSNVFGPSDVTVYNTAYKLFSIFNIVWTLVLTPYWAAFNDAYVKNDFLWIKKTMKNLSKFWIVLAIAMFVLLLFVNSVYKYWVGDAVTIPFSLSFCMVLYVLVSTLGNKFSYFLNGVGKIKIQLYASVFSGVINIPLCYFLAKNTSLGVSAIVMGTFISWCISPVIGYIQYKKIINRTAKGIWLK